MAIPAEDRKYFEELGEAQVRLQFNGIGFGPPRLIYAREWLAEIDEARRKDDEALQAEQMRLTQDTLNVAWIAAGAAIIAVVIGMFGLVLSLHQMRHQW